MSEIDLQTAHVTQTTGENGRRDWIVYNEAREDIYRLPKEWSEKQVMDCIHFARKFELEAFNKGIAFQKSKNPETIKTLQAMVVNLTAEKEIMKQENVKISDELDRLIIKYSN